MTTVDTSGHAAHCPASSLAEDFAAIDYASLLDGEPSFVPTPPCTQRSARWPGRPPRVATPATLGFTDR